MPRTGRPREFDRADAVRAAVRLFWEHGYEATSLAQLRAAMGDLSAASFYAAFGSKEGLFREAVAEYAATFGRVTDPLRDRSLPPRAAVERALRASARMQADPAHPLGCLVAQGMTNCSPENEPVGVVLAAERDANRRGLLACVRRAVAAGTLSAGTDAAGLAAMFNTFLLGLSAQARDGVPAATLDAAVTRLMAAWDAAAVEEGPMRHVPPAADLGPKRRTKK